MPDPIYSSGTTLDFENEYIGSQFASAQDPFSPGSLTERSGMARQAERQIDERKYGESGRGCAEGYYECKTFSSCEPFLAGQTLEGDNLAQGLT